MNRSESLPSVPENVALVLPIFSPGADRPAAIIVAGVSSRLPLDEAYRSFYEFVASGVSTAVASARAYEEESRRAEALAQLDAAKMAFFSHVSHEFRTPLMLMLGPVENILTRARAELSPAVATELDTVKRNGLRMLRLVNTLLDFSRIEAGRVRAKFQPSVTEAIDAAIRSKGVFEMEHRVMRVDGTPRWTFSRAIPLLDDKGAILEWFGAASDITGRRRGEEERERLVELHGGAVEARSGGHGMGSTFVVRLPVSAASSWWTTITTRRRAWRCCRRSWGTRRKRPTMVSKRWTWRRHSGRT